MNDKDLEQIKATEISEVSPIVKNWKVSLTYLRT